MKVEFETLEILEWCILDYLSLNVYKYSANATDSNLVFVESV